MIRELAMAAAALAFMSLASDVVLFAASWCGYCRQARSFRASIYEALFASR